MKAKSQIIKQKGREGGKAERREGREKRAKGKYVERRGRSERMKEGVVRVPGALHLSPWLVLYKDFFSPLSFDSFISPLFHFEILLHSRDTGLFSLFFLSLSLFFTFFSPHAFLSLSLSLLLSLSLALSPSFCDLQQKADGVSLTSEWIAQTCCEGRAEEDGAGKRRLRRKDTTDLAEEAERGER